MSEWGDKFFTEADNARLRAENEKLRYEIELDKFRGAGEIEAQKRIAMRFEKKASRLQAENDRLRELVRDMARAWWACDNERCPHGSSCDAAVSEGKLADCEMERRMAELGVEVEE